jgi:hypothetical protein
MQRNQNGKAMVTAFLLACAWLVGSAFAQEAERQAAMVETVQATATVMQVDRAGGTIKLKDNQGQVFVLKIPSEHAALFDTLRPGDMIDATYYQEAVLSVQKPGEPAPQLTEEQIRLRSGTVGVVARQRAASAKIVSMDPVTQMVVIRDPMGDTHSLKINDPALMAQLSELKPGDTVDITYTQALAVQVQPKK